MRKVREKSRLHGLRVLTVSDFVDKELTRKVEDRSLDPVDLIISCGDLAPEYLSFLRDRLDRPLFYVKGNHDIRYGPGNTLGCENINGRVVSFGGLNILGLEGSMWYNGGMNQYTEAMMKKNIFRLWFSIWRNRPIHMVVTHAPPMGIHDRDDLCHRGFESFVSLINKHQPDYFIHGHIHEAFENFEERVTRINSTAVVNTCGHAIIEV